MDKDKGFLMEIHLHGLAAFRLIQLGKELSTEAQLVIIGT